MSNLAGIAKFNGSIPLHPAGHVKLFMSEPLVYTNPHIWAAYLFAMLALGLAALYLFFGRRSINKCSMEPHTAPTMPSLTSEEAQFRRLKLKYDLLKERIETLDHDYACGKLELDNYTEVRRTHEQLLQKVKMQLNDYI